MLGKQIRDLDLSNVTDGLEGDVLQHYIPEFPVLEKLTLTGTLHPTLLPLRENTRITHLKLHTIQASNEFILPCLYCCPQLETLDIASTDFSGDGIQENRLPTSLRYINLSDTSINAAGLSAILRANANSVEVLFLNHCQHLTSIGPLPVMHNLEVLKMGHGTDQHQDSLAAILTQAPGIADLHLAHGNLTDAGVLEIQQHLHHLTTLNISNCKSITVGGFNDILRIQSLRRLDVSSTHIDMSTMMRFRAMLNLSSVTAYGCGLPSHLPLQIEEFLLIMEPTFNVNHPII